MASNRDELAIFGRRVKAVRNSLHISQRECAENLDISGSFLSEIEAGKVKPGFDFFKNLRSKYNINFDYLFTGEGKVFDSGKSKNKPEIVFDFEDDNLLIKEMLDYFRKSSFVRLAMLREYRVIMFENSDLIEHDVRRTLAKKKKAEEWKED